MLIIDLKVKEIVAESCIYCNGLNLLRIEVKRAKKHEVEMLFGVLVDVFDFLVSFLFNFCRL